MSKNLVQTTSTIKSRLELLISSRKDIDNRKELSTLESELSPKVTELRSQLRNKTFLRESGIEIRNSESITELSQFAEKLQVQFNADPSPSTLKKGRNWINLLDQISLATDELKKRIEQAWRDYSLSLYKGEKPEEIEARIAKTEENEELFSKFSDIYNELQHFRSHFPIDRNEIEKVKELSKKLESISGKFDDSVPEQVKIFLDEIQYGGAPLELYTDTVNNWLEEKGTKNSYRIVRQTDGR